MEGMDVADELEGGEGGVSGERGGQEGGQAQVGQQVTIELTQEENAAVENVSNGVFLRFEV